ncbi:MAG: hypothetical protein ABW034_17845 [Steroidobacteraceae bacterium]
MRQTAQEALHLRARAHCVGMAGITTVLSYPALAHADLWLADVSHLPRIGLKGPAAAGWLQLQSIEAPARPNTWRELVATSDQWSVIARLGNAEFLLEEDGDAPLIAQLSAQLQTEIPGVYPVPREDSEFVLGGVRAASALAEVCNIDFASLKAQPGHAILTLIAGVAVLVMPQFDGARRRYRIWCDPSFGAYLWTTLNDVIAHHSGAILGLEQLAAPPQLPRTTERIALGENS